MAVLCGAFASGALFQPGAFQPALTALVLAGAWQVLWVALACTNWQPARDAWLGWSQGAPIRRLPYTQAGSDADQVSRDLGQFSAWAREWLLPRHGITLLMAAAALVVALALALALGWPAVLLSVVVLIVIQVALLLCAGNSHPPAWAMGLASMGLPFLLGMFAFVAPTWLMPLACGAMGMALMAVKRGDTALLHAGSGAAIVLFMLLREPAAAFVIGVLWATSALLRPAGSRAGLAVLGLAGVALAMVL